MQEVTKIGIKKRKVSNLSELEMGNHKGGTTSETNNNCYFDTNFGCISIGCDTIACGNQTGYYCISMALTMPCETYPKC